jgi:mRNA-degrading endonuclease RelE of RelBE toxin-antitoxin system
MKFRLTRSYERGYKKLSTQNQNRVDEALTTLAKNPDHPSLNIEKVAGNKNIWSIRATQKLRITFEREGDVIILRKVGSHEVYR